MRELIRHTVSTIYTSNDGKEFDTAKACKEHEAECWINKCASASDSNCLKTTKKDLPELFQNLQECYGKNNIFLSPELNDVAEASFKVYLEYSDADDNFTVRPLSAVIADAKAVYDRYCNLEKE